MYQENSLKKNKSLKIKIEEGKFVNDETNEKIEYDELLGLTIVDYTDEGVIYLEAQF